MDPDETYYAMYEAMSNRDYVKARECAMALTIWFGSGGFWPKKYSRVEVKGYLASVLRRTNGP